MHNVYSIHCAMHYQLHIENFGPNAFIILFESQENDTNTSFGWSNQQPTGAWWGWVVSPSFSKSAIRTWSFSFRCCSCSSCPSFLLDRVSCRFTFRVLRPRGISEEEDKGLIRQSATLTLIALPNRFLPEILIDLTEVALPEFTSPLPPVTWMGEIS